MIKKNGFVSFNKFSKYKKQKIINKKLFVIFVSYDIKISFKNCQKIKIVMMIQ